MKKGTI